MARFLRSHFAGLGKMVGGSAFPEPDVDDMDIASRCV